MNEFDDELEFDLEEEETDDLVVNDNDSIEELKQYFDEKIASLVSNIDITTLSELLNANNKLSSQIIRSIEDFDSKLEAVSTRLFNLENKDSAYLDTIIGGITSTTIKLDDLDGKNTNYLETLIGKTDDVTERLNNLQDTTNIDTIIAKIEELSEQSTITTELVAIKELIVAADDTPDILAARALIEALSANLQHVDQNVELIKGSLENATNLEEFLTKLNTTIKEAQENKEDLEEKEAIVRPLDFN